MKAILIKMTMSINLKYLKTLRINLHEPKYDGL